MKYALALLLTLAPRIVEADDLRLKLPYEVTAVITSAQYASLAGRARLVAQRHNAQLYSMHVSVRDRVGPPSDPYSVAAVSIRLDALRPTEGASEIVKIGRIEAEITWATSGPTVIEKMTFIEAR